MVSKPVRLNKVGVAHHAEKTSTTTTLKSYSNSDSLSWLFFANLDYSDTSDTLMQQRSKNLSPSTKPRLAKSVFLSSTFLQESLEFLSTNLRQEAPH